MWVIPFVFCSKISKRRILRRKTHFHRFLVKSRFLTQKCKKRQFLQKKTSKTWILGKYDTTEALLTLLAPTDSPGKAFRVVGISNFYQKITDFDQKCGSYPLFFVQKCPKGGSYVVKRTFSDFWLKVVF